MFANVFEEEVSRQSFPVLFTAFRALFTEYYLVTTSESKNVSLWFHKGFYKGLKIFRSAAKTLK